MSSSEEYLENLLQSMMNGEVATPSKEELNDPGRQKSAIAMLSGEEPEQALPEISEKSSTLSSDNMSDMESMEAMLASMVDNLDENEDGSGIDTSNDLITDDIPGGDDLGADLSSLNITDFDPDETSSELLAGIDIDDIALEESGMEEVIPVGAEMDELSLEDLGLDDMALGEVDMDEVPIGGSAEGELPLDDLVLDDMALDEPDLADLSVDDTISGDMEMDDLTLEESDMDDDLLSGLVLDDTASDTLEMNDLALEESEADDIMPEESGADDMMPEEFGVDDMMPEESGMDNMMSEESDMDNLDLEGLDLDGLGADETALSEEGLSDMALDNMELEESNADDALLEELGLDDMLLEEPDNMALEENELDEMTDDFSLDESSMEDDLAEIHDLLDQSEQGEEIDDEMLALLESVSEPSDSFVEEDIIGPSLLNVDSDTMNDTSGGTEDNAEENASAKEKKKKKERKRKKKGKMQDNPAETDGIESLEGGEEGKSEKKPGAFARFLAFLTESDEENEDAADNEATDENTQLLEELNAEDKNSKKGKKEKKKKEKKGKKASNKEDGEEGAKAAKKKKPKKEKKEKKEKVTDDEAVKDTGKKLSKKKVIPVILFCITILLCILICTSVVPGYLQKRDARVAYDMGNYSQTFELLYGKSLTEEEETILQKSTIILKMERKLNSYRNYQKMGTDDLAALNALVQGAALYFELLPEAEQYNVTNEITNVYNEILAVLAEQYGLYETDVMEIISSEDDLIYTQRLTSIVYGISFSNGIGEEESGALQDVLPEEQEILDGLPEETEDIPFMDDVVIGGENSYEDGAVLDNMDSMDYTGSDMEGNEEIVPDEGEIKYIDPVSVEIHQNNG